MRVLLVCNFDHRAAPRFLDAFAREIETRDGWRIVGACDSGSGERDRSRLAAAVYRRLHGASARPRTVASADAHGVPVLGDSPGSVNDPRLVDDIARMDVDLALSFLCTQIWQAPLLGAVKRAVNHHDGLLPAHGGLWATAFSLYYREARSGFTFHDMVREIDAGPIIFEDTVPIRPADDLRSVVERKRSASVDALPQVFDLLGAGEPGRPQAGTGTCHTAIEARRIMTIDDPPAITAAELRHRLRSFGRLHVTVGGRRETVTAVTTRPGVARPRIPLADGELHIERISGRRQLPYRTVRRLAGRRFVERLS